MRFMSFMVEHIFISYSRVDSIFADQLAVDLESRGYKVWIDQATVRGGESCVFDQLRDPAHQEVERGKAQEERRPDLQRDGAVLRCH